MHFERNLPENQPNCLAFHRLLAVTNVISGRILAACDRLKHAIAAIRPTRPVQVRLYLAPAKLRAGTFYAKLGNLRRHGLYRDHTGRIFGARRVAMDTAPDMDGAVQ